MGFILLCFLQGVVNKHVGYLVLVTSLCFAFVDRGIHTYFIHAVSL